MGVLVRQRGTKWCVCINHKGKRKLKVVGDRKAAEMVASKLRVQLALGDFQIEEPGRQPTFQECAERWLEGHVRANCRPGTQREYRRLLERFAFPRFGAKPLADVGREDLKRLISEMQGVGLSRNTIAVAVAPVREIFNEAIDDGAKFVNPADRLGRYLKDKTDRRLTIVPLTAEEVQRLLEAAQRLSHMFYLFLLTAVRTGLRLGELIGLQWGDLDFNGRFVEVKRQWTRGAYGPTKSGKLRRVDMSLQLCEALRQAQDSRRAECAVQGRDLDAEEPVFCTSAGTPLDASHVRMRLLRRCLREAGLRQIHPHLLRHTFASLLLANGENLVYVRDQLGHHSITITVNTYGHLIPGSNKQAVDRLDDATTRDPRATSATVGNPSGGELVENSGVIGVSNRAAS